MRALSKTKEQAPALILERDGIVAINDLFALKSTKIDLQPFISDFIWNHGCYPVIESKLVFAEVLL